MNLISATMAFAKFVFIVLLVLAHAQRPSPPPLKLTFCKKRVITLVFRAIQKPKIFLYRSCKIILGEGRSSNFNCGGPFDNILKARCTKRKCPPGIKCNVCRVHIRPRHLPVYYHNQDGPSTLGDYFVQIRGPEFGWGDVFEQLDADFAMSGPDWFTRNRFQVGCKHRVTCYNDGRYTFDLAIYVQACTATLVREFGNTARNAHDCFKRRGLVKGIPPGEIAGIDCDSPVL